MEQIPVACKTCPLCGHDLITEKKDPDLSIIGDFAGLEDSIGDMDSDKVEKRRSVRAKRDKPDYYDALDYDSKRAKAIKASGNTPKRGPPGTMGSRVSPNSKVRRQVGYSSYQQQPRATLTWKTADDEEAAKRKGKKPNGKKDEGEDNYDYIEDIPQEKTLLKELWYLLKSHFKIKVFIPVVVAIKFQNIFVIST